MLGTAFGLGLCPNIPVKKDGILMLPPMSANGKIKMITCNIYFWWEVNEFQNNKNMVLTN